MGVVALMLAAAPAFAEEKGDCGTIVIPRPSDITAFNPEYSNSLYNQQAANLMFEQLIWINRYYQIDWERSIASAITTPDQGTTYNVTLRSWHWSDGVPVTSEDVAYTLRLIRQIGTYYPGYGAGGMPNIIKTLTVVDATHFQVVLTHQVNPLWFIYNGLSQLQPVPEHIWSHYTVDQIYQAQSTPAFFKVVDSSVRVARLDPGQDVVFVPNPGYEGPKVHFKRLVFAFVQSDGAAVQGIQSGQFDVSWLPDTLWQALNHVKNIYTASLQVHYIAYVTLNFRNPDVAFLRDVRVRQALQDAVDQPGMINLLFHGTGQPVYGPVPPVPPNFLSPAMRAGHYPVGYDPAKARALLAAAGFVPGPDGVMQKDGVPLRFTVIITGSADLPMIEAFQAYERKVGVDVRVRNMEFNEMLALLNSGSSSSWQAAILGTDEGGYPSGEELYQAGGYDNAGGYSDKTMDRLINDSVSKPGLDGLFAYEDYAAAQQPVIYLPTDPETFMISDRLHGMLDFENPTAQLAPDQLYCTGVGS